MRNSRVTTTATICLALAATGAVPAFGQQQDLRSPDARDTAQISQDLRSPDARDADAGRSTADAPEMTVVTLAQPAPSQPGGIDWGDAGIGAGGLLAVAVIGLGAGFAVLHRRHGAQGRAATSS